MDKKKEICKNCYTCEVSYGGDNKKDNKESLCRNCYTCQQGVDGGVTVNDMRQKGIEKKKKTLMELCRNCYTCQQGVGSDVTAGQKKSGGGMPMVYFIHHTSGCNLACRYCYATTNPGNMSKETMHQMLKWLFEIQPHKNIKCHFFGGEPTTRWSQLEDIVNIGNQLAKKNGVSVGWGMTTNGTLLNTERLDWIEKNFNSRNPFLLSIDGRKETHDLNRIYKDGKGSFDDIPVDEILSRFPNIEIRPTITPETVGDWFDDFRFLRNKGFKSIAIEPDFETDWSEKQLMDYRHLLEKLGEYYKYAQRSGVNINLKFLNTVLSQLRSPNPPEGRMCGVAWNSASIDWRGKLYACQRYGSYNNPDKWAMGDVWNGWDEFTLFKTRSLERRQVRGDVREGFDCDDCMARQFCMKGCNATYAKLMGSRKLVMPNYCRLTRIEVSVALDILADLGKLSLRDNSQIKKGGVCMV